MPAVWKITLRKRFQISLSHFLPAIAALVLIALSSPRSTCQVFAEDSTSKPARPNVVIILADDLGYASVGCYGADPAMVRTPHIDSLAAQGAPLLTPAPHRASALPRAIRC